MEGGSLHKVRGMMTNSYFIAQKEWVTVYLWPNLQDLEGGGACYRCGLGSGNWTAVVRVGSGVGGGRSLGKTAVWMVE